MSVDGSVKERELMEEERYAERSPERRVLGSIHNNTFSPTANLHLLTSVASELSEKEQSLQIPSKSSSRRRTDLKPRKDKSLGILCDKFLAMFPFTLEDGCSVEINLDKVAEELGIVKRRIYDIINILESLHMTSRIAKNRYQWHGDRNLKPALSHLRRLALKFGLDAKIKEIQTQQTAVQSKSSQSSVGSSCGCYNNSFEDLTLSSWPNRQENFFSEDRTLGIMCQKFIMLFLVLEEGGIVNLDLATQLLVNAAAERSPPAQQSSSEGTQECCCQPRLKTKVRRLYDIANVLTSLGLIRKERLALSPIRKPVFVYSGPPVEDDLHHIEFDGTHTMRNSLLMVSINQQDGSDGRLGRKRKDGPPDEPAEKRLCVAEGEGEWNGGAPVTRRLCSLEDILRVAEQELKLLSEESSMSSQTSSSDYFSSSQASSSDIVSSSQEEKSDLEDAEAKSPCEEATAPVAEAATVVHEQNECNLVATQEIASPATETPLAGDPPVQTNSKTSIVQALIIKPDRGCAEGILDNAVDPASSELSFRVEGGQPAVGKIRRFTVTRKLVPSHIIVRKDSSNSLKFTVHHAQSVNGVIRLRPVISAPKVLPVTCIKTFKPVSVLAGSQGAEMTRVIDSKKTVRLVPVGSMCLKSNVCP